MVYEEHILRKFNHLYCFSAQGSLTHFRESVSNASQKEHFPKIYIMRMVMPKSSTLALVVVNGLPYNLT